MAYGTMSIGNAGFTKKFISILFLLMHPKGTLFSSDDPTSPAELFGGTWEQIKDSFILAAGDTYAAGSTGGNATVIIGKTNLPNVRLDVETLYSKGASGNAYDVVNVTHEHSDGSGNFSRTGKTYPLGDGTPLDILPPYYSAYIWRRVA